MRKGRNVFIVFMLITTFIFCNIINVNGLIKNSYANASVLYENLSLGDIHGSNVSGDLESGYVVKNIGKSNNMAVFDVVGTAFDFEADMEIIDGQEAAGLMFGVADINASNNDWSAVHLQPDRGNTLRVFCEKNWYAEDGFDSKNISLPSGTSSTKIRLKISIDESDRIRVYINGGVSPVFDSVLKNYNGGHVGIMTHNTGAKFTNITLKGVKLPAVTELEVVGAGLNEEFDGKSSNYTSFVEASLTSIRLKVKLDKGNYVINNQIYASGEETRDIPIQNSVTNIIISVLSQEKQIDVITLSIVKGYDKENAYNETYRPQFHFSQQQFWCNDPNGLIYNEYTQEYHMFYQYNPTVLHHDGKSHWGHAVSKDLVHWTELPIALYPDEIGNIASGSAVIDYNNTCGLFSENTPPESRMVLIYTYFANSYEEGIGGNQRQAIAYSEDNGYTWKKYEGNPVIPNVDNLYDYDFRDPKVYWMEESKEWLMVIAGGLGRIFTSKNLIHWKYNGHLSLADGTKIYSECPDIFPLAVDGDKNNVKWVYICGGVHYVVGNLVRQNGLYKFKAESGLIPLFTDAGYGRSMYATQSFNNMSDGRVVLISWMPQFDAESLAEYGKIWNGNQSIPMEAKLVSVNGEIKLTVEPISELESLRTNLIYSVNNINVNEGDDNILNGISGKLFDIEASFTIGTANELGFKLRSKSGESVKVKYSINNEILTVDKSQSSVLVTGILETSVSLQNNKLNLRILVDSSIIDVFANDGLGRINGVYYTDASADGMEFYTVGGNVTIDYMKIYAMSSAWKKEDVVNTSPLITDIILSGATLNSPFNSQIFDYNVTANETNVKISPIFADSKTVTVCVNGEEVEFGKYKEISLKKGANIVTVSVSDQVGRRVYTLNINCTASGCRGASSCKSLVGHGFSLLTAVAIAVFWKKKRKFYK